MYTTTLRVYNDGSSSSFRRPVPTVQSCDARGQSNPSVETRMSTPYRCWIPTIHQSKRKLTRSRAQHRRRRRGGRALEFSERLSMGDQIPMGTGPASVGTPCTSPAGVGNTHQDMTPWTSPAGVGTPRGSILQEFLETLDQGLPTPRPNALLAELGLDPSGPGLATDTFLSQ